MAGIRDVAKRANVAASTVSRALNNSGYVSQSAREKIKKAIEELDYIPDSWLRNLYQQKSAVVGVIINSLEYPYFATVTRFIENKLAEKGYSMMLCATQNSKIRERIFFDMLKRGQIDGIIAEYLLLNDREYQHIQKPVVTLDRHLSDIPLVCSDHHTGGQLAAEHLIEKGCKKILLIEDNSNYLSSTPSYKSCLAFKERLYQVGINPISHQVNWKTEEKDYFHTFAKKILNTHPDIDAIFAADIPAIALFNEALRKNIAIPEQLKIIAYDGSPWLNQTINKLTCIEQPFEQLAEKSVEIITSLIEGEEVTEKMTVIPVQFIQGETS
ncbi:LacI family DNA-binding transcriptional regulator [Proteus myxofaciens]|uniref:LacI family sucrose operon repressor n=1 Tax=Proteus myxofaciens ATCC 19692 TaxID=1354337 RepID=A0A198G1D3_9GAMM|nr:LacI family DNA-binding transcriptional regulator [Proteus myxofaciens]OAT30923.1 LacI family sucrose operon repressor [Proteus myxofaciens ATCC 19692]